jgi:cyclopropane-fatty-acyl-phospholipid synthase
VEQPKAVPVAETASGFLGALFGDTSLPVTIRWWDGTVSGTKDASTSVVVRSPLALRRLLYSPDEVGLARAYVAGELDVVGSMFDALSLRDLLGGRREHVEVGLGGRARRKLLQAAWRLGVLGPPLPAPREEARLRGRLHSRSRDMAAVTHHYDTGNDFYRLFLGDSMTYSCAYFARNGMTLDEAQSAKYELICRKLGLKPGMRLLDVGCGWGGMLLHAVANHGVTAVGVTLSKLQADLAAKRIAEAGLADRAEVRVQDYRDISDGPFDAVSSIGMFEHVGVARLGDYFGNLHSLLVPKGRLLNHAISRPPGRAARFHRRSFIARYVFPDGELQEVGSVVSAMQGHGFEARDVESLREHYAQTLRHWVAGLESNWERACELVGPNRARVWRLYMAGSALGFEAGRINLHQVLGVKTDNDGQSGMPPTRAEMLGARDSDREQV